MQVCRKKLEDLKIEGLHAQLFLLAVEAGLTKDELFLSSETVSLPGKVIPSLLLSKTEILPYTIPIKWMCESHWSAPAQHKVKWGTALCL